MPGPPRQIGDPGEVGHTALRLAPIVLAARGVAFLVPVLIAHLFGVSAVTDAFFYALAFPVFILVIVVNALGTVATPLMARVARDTPHELPDVVGGAALASALLTVALGGLLLLALPPLLPRITAFPPDVQALTWRFVLELLPFLGCTGAVVLLRAACEIRGRFVPVAAAPLLRGGTTLAALALLSPSLSHHALPLSLFLGVAAEIALTLVVLIRSGLPMRVPRRIDPRLRAGLAAALPILAGEGMVAMNLVVDKAFAGTLEPGMVSLLEYADRTRLIPQTLLESTLVPVAFATWAHLVARRDQRGYARQLDQSLRWVGAWTAAPLAGLFIGRYVIVATLFARGAFDEAHVSLAADAFGAYLPGLWAMMLGSLALRAHVVEHRLRPILVLGATSLVLNGALNAMLVGPLGIRGLALASSVVWTVVAVGYLLWLAPTLRPAIRIAAWLPVLAVVLAAAVLAVAMETRGAPTSMTDPALWLAAACCLGLWGFGIRTSTDRIQAHPGEGGPP